MWVITRWPESIDDSLIPFQPQAVNDFHLLASRACGTDFSPFSGCVFIGGEVEDLETLEVTSWFSLAAKLEAQPSLIPSWYKFFGKEESPSDVASLVVVSPEENVIPEWQLEILEEEAGQADRAIAFENSERGSLTSYTDPGVTNLAVMQMIDERRVYPFLHRLPGRKLRLFMTREACDGESLPLVWPCPRANIVWSEKHSWIAIHNPYFSGMLFFASDMSALAKVVARSELDAFMVSSEDVKHYH